MVLPPGELVQTVVVYRGLIRGCSLTSTNLAGFFFLLTYGQFFFSPQNDFRDGEEINPSTCNLGKCLTLRFLIIWSFDHSQCIVFKPQIIRRLFAVTVHNTAVCVNSKQVL